jgi:hypothetical protein
MQFQKSSAWAGETETQGIDALAVAPLREPPEFWNSYVSKMARRVSKIDAKFTNHSGKQGWSAD